MHVPRSVVFVRLVSVSIIVMFAVGVAIAAIPTASGSVSFCVQKFRRVSGTGPLGPMVILDRIGTLRAIDFENGQLCEEDEQRLGFNVSSQKGDPGPQGPQGPQGPPGPQGPAGGSSVGWSGSRFPGDEADSVMPSTNLGRVIGSMFVPPGNYALTATVNVRADYSAQADSDRYNAACWIDARGIVDQQSVQATRTPAVQQVLTLHGVMALEGFTTIRVRCKDDESGPASWQHVSLSAVTITEAHRVNLGGS